MSREKFLALVCWLDPIEPIHNVSHWHPFERESERERGEGAIDAGLQNSNIFWAPNIEFKVRKTIKIAIIPVQTLNGKYIYTTNISAASGRQRC